jgi:uncharacterized protein YoxC
MISTVINILLIILILAATAFCVFAIIYLKKIAEQVEAVRKDVHEYIEKPNPILENMQEISGKVNDIATEVGNYWEEIDDLIKKIRERFSMISSNKNLKEIEYPVKYLVRNAKALASGTSAFWKEYKHK